MRFLRLLVIFCGISMAASAVTADDYFAQQRWKDALAAYKKSEFPTTTTLERMGTCAAHLQRHADAVLYWRRAQRYSAWGRYLYFGRMVAGAQAMAGVERATHPVISAMSAGLCAMPLILWQLLLLLLWGILLWRGRRFWKQGQFGLLGSLVLGLFFIGAGTLHCYRKRTGVVAVVVESAPLRTGPSERYTQLVSLTPASEVVVLETRSGGGNGLYHKVVTDSQRGWVAQKNIRLL